jgi:hypothetical protein
MKCYYCSLYTVFVLLCFDGKPAMPCGLCIEGCSLLSPAYQQQGRRSRVMYKFSFPFHFSSAASPVIFASLICKSKSQYQSIPVYAPLPSHLNEHQQQASTSSVFSSKTSISLSPINKSPTVIQWRTSLEGRADIRFCAAADAYYAHLAPSLSASSLAILSSSPSTTAPLRRPFFRPFLTSSLSSLLLFLPAPAIPASPAIRCASLSRRSRFRASRSSSCGSLSFCPGAGGAGSAVLEDFCGFSFSRS